MPPRLLEAQAERQLRAAAAAAGGGAGGRRAWPQQPLRRVELWDLVSAFGRLMRETLALQPRQIVMDETPIHVHMERILELLCRAAALPFSELFTPPHTRGRLLGLFLAMLELIKGRSIVVEQPEAFGDLFLSLALSSPKPTGREPALPANENNPCSRNGNHKASRAASAAGLRPQPGR